jgi:signal transduction histidine kinase
VSNLPRRAKLYVTAVILMGMAVLAYSCAGLTRQALSDCLPFLLIAALGSTMRVRLLPLALKSRSHTSGAAEMSVAFAFGYAAILYGGAAAGTVTALVSGLASTLLFARKRHPLFRILFNCASLVLSAWIAAQVYGQLGGPSGRSLGSNCLIPVAASVYAYYIVNTMSVALAVALTQRLPFWSTWSDSFLWTAAPGYFVGAVAAVSIAYYYNAVGPVAFAVTTPAMLLSYRSYKAYIDKVEETQKRLEEVQRLYKESLQLVTQSEKLASIGRLAGGVAHEINNPLMVILGRAELALMDLDEEHAATTDLEIIVSETKRIANIVKNLLRFSRQDQQESLLPVEVNEIVDRAVELTRYQMTVDNISIETRYAPSLPTVLGNAGQLQQVFTNIIINAYQAMAPKGGRLLVETRMEGAQVEVLFTDTGCGIPPDQIKRIFEPFFTTKNEQEGTGLGLSVSYGIVADHGGEIHVQSEVNVGSTFIISLPAADADAVAQTAASVPAQAVPTGAA